MTEESITVADVEHLATVLDAIDVEDKDRATLHAVFALAGQTVAAEQGDEVSGFAYDAFLAIAGRPNTGKGELTGGLFDAFQSGKIHPSWLNPQPLPP